VVGALKAGGQVVLAGNPFLEPNVCIEGGLHVSRTGWGRGALFHPAMGARSVAGYDGPTTLITNSGAMWGVASPS
jgi:hypothetical protein